MIRLGHRAVLTLAASLLLALPAPSQASAPVSMALRAAAASLETSAGLGHGEKVSQAASAPGGPIVPEGCRNFGHWVSSEAHGTTCQDNPRPGKSGKPGSGG